MLNAEGVKPFTLSAFGIQHSAFRIRHWAFGIRHFYCVTLRVAAGGFGMSAALKRGNISSRIAT